MLLCAFIVIGASFEAKCCNFLSLMSRDGDIWWKFLWLKNTQLHLSPPPLPPTFLYITKCLSASSVFANPQFLKSLFKYAVTCFKWRNELKTHPRRHDVCRVVTVSLFIHFISKGSCCPSLEKNHSHISSWNKNPSVERITHCCCRLVWCDEKKQLLTKK